MSSSKTRPKVFISYSHDSPEHKERVLELADRLVEEGIDIVLDQYEKVPPDNWALWMEKQIDDADFVLIVCTQNYLDRVQQKVKQGEGRGAKWEGLLTYEHIYENDSINQKFIPVLLEGGQESYIPRPLRLTNSYRPSDEEGYDKLYRRITDQQETERPLMATVRERPPRQRQKSDTRPSKRAASAPSKPWLVPHERNRVFTGRAAILKDLRADLLKNGRQALSGLGGIGKTQIAVEYAFRHREDYSAVLWTFADTEQAISSGFSMMAQKLGLPEQESKEQAAVTDAVKHWLEHNDGWLLVFDNADTPELAKRFLPEQGQGHILLTSRHRVFHALDIIQAREVDLLSAADSRQFLLRRTGQSETRAVDDLAKELGYLPLALEQAAAYIMAKQASFQGYLSSFRKRRLALLKQQDPVMGTPKEQTKRTVETAWLLNFAEVEKSPASADLLRLCAFLAPDMIPLELLEKGAAELGEALAEALASGDSLAPDELLEPLTRYSLIRRSPETRSFSIHPLVQEVTRDGMDASKQNLWAERAVRAVGAAFPGVEFERWPECERFIPQALVCNRLIEKLQMEFPAAAHLLNQAAFYLDDRAQYLTAEPLYRRALTIYEKVLGTEHPNTATCMNNLAELYRVQGKYEEAEPLCRRTLMIREKVLGAEHPITAISLNNLAALYRVEGKYEEAELLYRRALGIREKSLEADLPVTATSLSNLAELLGSQGKNEDAEPLYQRALGIREKVLGAEHPDVAQSLNNLASLMVNQGRYEDAEPLYRRALNIKEKVLGASHPSTATSLHNLALLMNNQGKYEEAEPLLRRSFAICEKALGMKHPTTATFGRNLVLFLREQGKEAEAEALERKMKE